MAPTVEPVANANGVIPGLQSSIPNRAIPQQSNMISELPNSAQRDILNVMLQAQNFNPSAFDPQQLAHIQNLQQQQQNLLAAQQATVTSTQNQVHQNGSISPPKLSLPMPMTNQMVMRQKRPSQPELFPMNEPINKRTTGGTFAQGGNFPLQQLVSMNNPQQMALLQQVQQTNMPTSSSMHMSPMGVRAPSLRVPFPTQGFSGAFNPTSGILPPTDDALQNYIRNMQTMPPPPRGQVELAQIMSLINANNQTRLNMNFEEMKRKESLPQLTGIDQNAFAQQFAMRQNVPQQQQQQLMQMAALAQQNEQRKRSMSFSQSMAPNQMAFSLPQFSTPPREPSAIFSHASLDSNSQTPLGIQTTSPNKEANQSTPSVSETGSSQSGSNNSTESRLGTEEIKYQIFLHLIDLFNKKIIEEHHSGMLSEKLDIPPQVVEAARHTHLAKISVPTPTIPLDEIQPGWQSKLENALMRNIQTEVTNSST
uniref:Uncharacterized protein n=1 Tax=Panagrolaimus sp. JU765 TaxID=591449 RepID=A0AC34QH52_9BILA